MKRFKRIAAPLLLLSIFAACSFPIYFPDLSYAAAFYGKLRLESSFILRDLNRNIIRENRVPSVSMHGSNSAGGGIYFATDEGFEDIQLWYMDGSNLQLQKTSTDPLIVDYTLDEIEAKLVEGIAGGDWFFYGLSFQPAPHNDLQRSALHPLERGGFGSGMLMVQRFYDSLNDEEEWIASALQPTTPDATFTDPGQPFRPFLDSPFWIFTDFPPGTNQSPYTKFDIAFNVANDYDEGFTEHLPPNQQPYDLIAIDSDSPDSSYMTYLFRFWNTGIIYEALSEFSFDFTTINAPTASVSDEYLLTRVSFPTGLFDGPDPIYVPGGEMFSVREGGLRRSYITAVELAAVDFVAFGWTSGTDRRGEALAADRIADASASIIADNQGPIYGVLLGVLHDGTLVFREAFDNGLILYREGDRRRKRFNPGTIRFLREYRDSTTGEYRVSFTGLYYSEFYGGEFDDSFVTVQSDAYSMPTAEFLDIAGY
jgi:hypothetical protein